MRLACAASEKKGGTTLRLEACVERISRSLTGGAKRALDPFRVLGTVLNGRSELAPPKHYEQSTCAPLVGVVLILQSGRLAPLLLLLHSLCLPSRQ